MSQENVELVRRIIEEGPIDRDPEQLLDIWDPHGDYYPVEEFPETRPCHGVEEISHFSATSNRLGSTSRSRSRR